MVTANQALQRAQAMFGDAQARGDTAGQEAARQAGAAARAQGATTAGVQSLWQTGSIAPATAAALRATAPAPAPPPVTHRANNDADILRQATGYDPNWFVNLPADAQARFNTTRQQTGAAPLATDRPLYFDEAWGGSPGLSSVSDSLRQAIQQAEMSAGLHAPVVRPPVLPLVRPQTQTPEQEAQSRAQAIQDALTMAGQAGGASGNLIQQLQQMILNRPQSERFSRDEILRRAQDYAALLFDPQNAALTRGLEQQRLAAQAQRGGLSAAFAGVNERTNRLMRQAQERAVEGAIARGGGRSGAVEWLSNQLQAPILEQQQAREAQYLAQTGAIGDRLALTEQQVVEQLQELATQRGRAAAQKELALEELDYARQTGDWQRAFDAAERITALDNQQRAQTQNFTLGLLPYVTGTWREEEDVRQGLAETFSAQPQLDAPVPVREYVTTNFGRQNIGFDAVRREVIVGSYRIPINRLAQYGGRFDETTQQAFLPPSVINRLIRG